MQFLKKFFSRTNIILYIVIFALFAFDLLSKYVIEIKIAYGETVCVIPGVLDFTYILNKGAAWSIFANISNATLILGIISVVFAILCYVFNYYVKSHKNFLYYLGFCLTVAGTLGNAYDRLFLGAVRDFLKTTFISFPIFNIADTCVVLGLISICAWQMILVFKKNDKNTNVEYKMSGFSSNKENANNTTEVPGQRGSHGNGKKHIAEKDLTKDREHDL